MQGNNWSHTYTTIIDRLTIFRAVMIYIMKIIIIIIPRKKYKSE